MRAKQNYIRCASAKFKVVQYVRIRKEKLKFSKGGEQNYTIEIFQIHKVVPCTPRLSYELVDLLRKHIEGNFMHKNSVFQLLQRKQFTR
jgi:chemotaxis signal transduction protein